MSDTKGESFGEWLSRIRLEKKVTQAALATSVGIHAATPSRIEYGRTSPPSVRVLLAWAEQLDVDPDEMVVRTGKIPPEVEELLRDLDFMRWLRRQLPQFQRERESKEKAP